MSRPNFVNLHVLISHSPSCLNRDDMGQQKTAIFGGKTRVRISSQSLKRAFRFSDTYRQAFSRSTRTRRLLDQLVADLDPDSGIDAAAFEQCALYVAAIFEGKTKEAEIQRYARAKSGHIETQIIPFSSHEIEAIGGLLREAAALATEKARITHLKQAVKELEQRLRHQLDLDVALSGRMANSELIHGVDGALAVAHALTTHTVEPQDIDWFTAVDDLTQDAGESGAGHLNVQQFSAGVFYRYASLNLRQLQYNLGLLDTIDAPETAAGRARALAIAAHVLQLMTTVVPEAKQQSFAAHNIADCALVSLADQPISLANAFETPVAKDREGGYLRPSIETMLDYWRRLNRAYGLNETARVFSLDAATGETPPHLDTLPALQTWLREDGHS
ncbi:type I-E CRISPR-associated protein Cas7/Cse4/CasC [Marichromatium gracile]|uniref:CRISPR-associated Cse4 family protein n=1 Tax=Marichromatium gracile TaxID=1048 RepID=A0A4R4ACN3_MARGR|nr:type I-E CRISPR-associated protein Cas7/Cse4/CasC [Marichromatium gracile]MBK1710323.1 type I-E CRISPR-associated protein Cas7/Cse4/CasC [Marichromatium gracile]TCW36366.1 CRISPR-associated Cse4 family protein [Marichromatium gracile]